MAQEPSDVDVSPVGIGIALFGAAAMVIAAFLPLWDEGSVHFVKLVENSLIQSSMGWAVVGLAIGGALGVFRAYRARKRTWVPIVLGLTGIGLAVLMGATEEWMRLCPVDAGFSGEGCETASPGVGVYVAGVGALLMTIGGLQIRNSEAVASPAPLVSRLVGAHASAEEATKMCPDCAETILSAARVCRHCGYRFDAP